jgi:hypothetical protein
LRSPCAPSEWIETTLRRHRSLSESGCPWTFPGPCGSAASLCTCGNLCPPLSICLISLKRSRKREGTREEGMLESSLTRRIQKGSGASRRKSGGGATSKLRSTSLTASSTSSDKPFFSFRNPSLAGGTTGLEAGLTKLSTKRRPKLYSLSPHPPPSSTEAAMSAKVSTAGSGLCALLPLAIDHLRKKLILFV